MIKVVTSAQPIIDAIADASICIIDTETSSLKPFRDGKILAGIGVKARGGQAFYLPVRHKDKSKQGTIKDVAALCSALHGKALVFHNPKFDMAVLLQDGIDISAEHVYDTVVTTRLVRENEPNYELKRLGKSVLGREDAAEPERQLKAYMRKAEIETYDKIPVGTIAPYVEQDLILTEDLFDYAIPLLWERGLGELLELERRLTRILFVMECVGFKMDQEYIDREYKSVKKIVDDMEQQSCELATTSLRERLQDLRDSDPLLEDEEIQANIESLGKVVETLTPKFNLSSPHDIKKIFVALGVESTTKTKKGGQSWNKAALAAIDHPLATSVSQWRIIRNISNYYENFNELMGPDGVLHPSLHQAGARTGRMSCREPNLQNIPRFEGVSASYVGVVASMQKLRRELSHRGQSVDGDLGEVVFDEETQAAFTGELEGSIGGKVRGAFVPREGKCLLFFDWSQIELRLFANYSGETELLEAFDLGLDVHRVTALAAFGSLPKDEDSLLFKWFRNMGKQIAFGLLYGMGIKLLALEIGRSEEEATEFMDRYFTRFSRAKRWIKHVHSAAKKDHDKWCPAGCTATHRGWVKDWWGRRRYLRSDRVYQAVNFLVQGSAADLMKDALVRVGERLLDRWSIGELLTASPLMTVHDELIFECSYAEADDLVALVLSEMEQCAKLNMDLKVDVEWSPTRWGEKLDLACPDCSGHKKTVKLPQNVLLKALYNNDRSILDNVKTYPCDRCQGRGYDMTPLHDMERQLHEIA